MEGIRKKEDDEIVGWSVVAWLAKFRLAMVTRQVLVACSRRRLVVARQLWGVVYTNYACPPTCNFLALKFFFWCLPFNFFL